MQKSSKYFRNTQFARNLFLILFLLWFFVVSFSIEDNDEVLIVLQDRKITKSEFLYSFHKNYNDSGYFDIDHFFDQFIDMHLKLAQARQEHLDKKIDFINDLTNFRIQLAAPYLTDNQKEEELAREAYERLKFEVNASHILAKINNDDTLCAYNKAIQLRNKILAGESFEAVARGYSDDPNVKLNSGNLGYFSAFQSDYNFEKAVFEMNQGDLSMPVKSSIGYHIIQHRDKRRNHTFKEGLPSFEEMKSKLIEWIKRPSDPRLEIIQKSISDKLKKEWSYTEYNSTSQTLLSLSHHTFNEELVIPKDVDPFQVLCSIDRKNLTIADFLNYISDQDTSSCNNPIKIDISSYYKKFILDRLIKYENYKLEDKYPEFRYQLLEYRDAMLLLEITKQQVWLKSGSDTLGLKNFYKNNIRKYSDTANDKNSLQTAHTTSEIPDEVLSDYQSFLMKSWIKELHKKYKVQINQDIYLSIKESIIREQKF